MNVQLVLLGVYSALLVVIGVWIARRVRGASDFFVAGRRLSAPLLFSTVLAANIGAGSTIGASGQAYRDGLSAWWWNGSAALGSLALAFVIGPRIWRIARDHNLYTAGDFLEWRYSPAVRGVVAGLIWVGTLFILAAQLIAGAAILEVVAGLPRWGGALIGGLVMTAYFVAGGLLSSAWVNLVQLCVLIGGFLVAVPIVVASVGGLGALAEVAATAPGFTDPFYSTGPGSGWTFLFLLAPAFVISPGLVQKAYGAADERTVRVGIGVQALVLMLFAFLPVLIGMAGRVAHPDVAVRDQVLPLMFTEHLHPVFGGLALAAVFSAEVSTCDAILFMLATSLSKDLYKRFVNPAASDHRVLAVARLASLVGGTLGVVLAVVLPPSVILALGIFYSLLAVSLFVPVVGGLFVRAAGSREAFAAIAAGVSVRLGLQVFNAGRGIGVFDPTLLGTLAAAVGFFLTLGLAPTSPKGSHD
ncbi:MAG: sodium:solute symporter family protein [Acidobacteriota bacterium]